MSSYNPGPGWRAADQQDDVRDCIAYWDSVTRTWSRWVREALVPALPTSPHTVIRAHWGADLRTDLWWTAEGNWVSPLGSTYDEADMAQLVRFEVLSEPRAVTAKALPDRINNELLPLSVQPVLITVADEYGVEL